MVPEKACLHMQYPLVKYFILSESITPIAGSCGGRPNPKKVTDASWSYADYGVWLY